jgi:hypothetical protein
MTRARLGALITCMLAVCALGLGLASGSAGAAPARPAVQQISVQMVVFDCPGHPAPLVRPGTFIISCADDGVYLNHLHWTSWTSSIASAAGTLEMNTCTPSCVAGHFKAYPALVVFWGNIAVKNHPGEHSYTMMTEILTGTRPRYYDYQTHKWVTEPVTQTSRLLTFPGTYVPQKQ